MVNVSAIRERFAAVGDGLNERSRRLFAAAEAKTAGHGGIAAASRATGLARSTIGRGLKDMADPGTLSGVVRRPGSGRPTLTETDPTLLDNLRRLLEPATMGDPMRPLLWVSKSHAKLAEALRAMGHKIKKSSIPKLLVALKYRRRVNRKTLEGSRHPDRNAQFEHINAAVIATQAAGQPVISIDTKKKELIGPYKNGGSDYRPEGCPDKVNEHDFADKDLGKAIPYGVYDIAANTGCVSVGIDNDTAQFSVNSIRRWLDVMGRERYPDMNRLMITADGGGSNGSRVRLFKVELQKLADETALTLQVCHYPPGTSKWNKIGVSRTHPQTMEVWSYTRDGGRPPEAGSQVQASNHCKPLSSKAMVVSVAAKGGIKSRQVWSGEASESKPSMTCRNSIGDVKTGGAIFSRDQFGGGPEACPSGIRHVGGAKPDQALVWNVRTCRPDAKGRSPSGENHKDQSTNAGHRGGAVRSRAEGSVMGLDRRDCVVQPRPGANR
jgi:Rhodopirellula transposase DDE domain